jgi:hypothetical protein
MNEANASTRVSVAPAAQLGSPEDVTPTITSTPPIVAKAGPPESPLHVCDGDGESCSALTVRDARVAVPVRFSAGEVSLGPVRPKPTSRRESPTEAASSGAGGNGHGVAPAGGSSARSTIATSFASVAGSKAGCTWAARRGTSVPPFGGAAPKYASGSESLATQCAAVRRTRGDTSVAVHTSVPA